MKRLCAKELHTLQHEVLKPRNICSPTATEDEQPFKDCTPQHGDASATNLSKNSYINKQLPSVNTQDTNEKIEGTLLYEQILIAYHKFCLLTVEDRPTITKLRWNPTEQKQTVDRGKVACMIIETYTISTINDLNALYYAVIITLCKTIPKGEKPKGDKADSKEATLLKKLDTARGWLSWLVVLKRFNPLPPTTHHLLKGQQYGE
eukprot:1867844-Ditylum_brightwellii.AAC.1